MVRMVDWECEEARPVVFVKAVKCLSMGFAVTPLGGCAVGVGAIFGSFIKALAFSPDLEDTLFTQALLGFALIETFMVITVGVVVLIYSF